MPCTICGILAMYVGRYIKTNCSIRLERQTVRSDLFETFKMSFRSSLTMFWLYYVTTGHISVTNSVLLLIVI